MSPSVHSARIGIVVTGSIAAYKACEVVSRLVQEGHTVRAVATAAALRFVGEATLEGLTGSQVLTDLFAPGAALEHIEFSRWADLVLVCPATANTLNRFAAGLADDLSGALFLARDPAKPFLVAPAMNPMMWSHPATRASVERLRDWGVRFVPLGSGRTACDEYGEGRLAEPPDIVAHVESALARPGRRLRVLVTSGGTSEPIDAVRVITNLSTGHTGAGIAGHFSRCGHDVVLLRARTAPAAPGCADETFFSFSDLAQALERRLGGERFDAVIHAAAVGDFGVDEVVVDGIRLPPGGAKLESAGPPVLVLRRHRKLVDGLRKQSLNSRLKVIAFKLTAATDIEDGRRAAGELLTRSGADLVVHNDIAARAGPEDFPAELVRPDGKIWSRCSTRSELAAKLEEFLIDPT